MCDLNEVLLGIPSIVSELLSRMRDNACGIDFHPQILFSTFGDVPIPTCIPIYDRLTEKVMRVALIFTHRYYFRLLVMYEFLHASQSMEKVMLEALVLAHRYYFGLFV